MMTMSATPVVGLPAMPSLMEPNPLFHTMTSPNSSRSIMDVSSCASARSRSVTSAHSPSRNKNPAPLPLAVSPSSSSCLAPLHLGGGGGMTAASGSGAASSSPSPPAAAFAPISPSVSPSNSTTEAGAAAAVSTNSEALFSAPSPPSAGSPRHSGRQSLGASCGVFPSTTTTTSLTAAGACLLPTSPIAMPTHLNLNTTSPHSIYHNSSHISELVSTYRQYAAVQKSHSVDDVLNLDSTTSSMTGRRKRLPASRRSNANLSASVTEVPRPNVMLNLPGHRCLSSAVSSPDLLSSGSSSHNHTTATITTNTTTTNNNVNLEEGNTSGVPSVCSSSAINAHSNPSSNGLASLGSHVSRYNPASAHLIVRSTPFRRLRFPSFDAVEIIPGLFLSAHHCAADLEALRAFNISLVVNVASECSVKEELQKNQVGVRYVKFFLRDHSDENIAPILAPMAKIMHNQLHRRAVYLAAKKQVEMVSTPTQMAAQMTGSSAVAGPASSACCERSATPKEVETEPQPQPQQSSSAVDFAPRVPELSGAAAAAAAALASVDERDAGGVLVHCRMGVSRSATLILAYLMLFGDHISDLDFDGEDFAQLWCNECFEEEARVVKHLLGSTYGWRFQKMKGGKKRCTDKSTTVTGADNEEEEDDDDDDNDDEDTSPLASRTVSSMMDTAAPALLPIPWTNAMPLMDFALTPPCSSNTSYTETTQSGTTSPARARVRLQREVVCTVCQQSRNAKSKAMEGLFPVTAAPAPAKAPLAPPPALSSLSTSSSSSPGPAASVKASAPLPPPMPIYVKQKRPQSETGSGALADSPASTHLHPPLSHVPLVTFLSGAALVDGSPDDDAGVASQSLTPSTSSNGEDGNGKGTARVGGCSSSNDHEDLTRIMGPPRRIGMTMERALEYVHARKPDINPNIGFVMALQDLSAQLGDGK